MCAYYSFCRSSLCIFFSFFSIFFYFYLLLKLNHQNDIYTITFFPFSKTPHLSKNNFLLHDNYQQVSSIEANNTTHHAKVFIYLFYLNNVIVFYMTCSYMIIWFSLRFYKYRIIPFKNSIRIFIIKIRK